MARARKAKQEIDRDEGRSDDFAPPDRADQILADSNEAAEEVDILARDDAPADQAPTLEIEEEGAGEETIEPRETRKREDYDDESGPPRRAEGDDDDGEDGRRGRRRKRADDEEYSVAVQRRINREIALRKRTEDRLKEERTARLQLERRILNIERQQLDKEGEASIKEIETKIQQKLEELTRAKEENNTALEVRLQHEIDELRTEKTRLQVDLDLKRKAAVTREPPDAGSDDDPGERPKASPQAQEWKRANRRWWNTERWAKARNDAISHDEIILEEINDGTLDFEPYSDEHLAELCRRLKTDYPDLEVRTIDGDLFDEGDDGFDGDEGHMSDTRNNRRDPKKRARAPMGGLGGRDGRRERNEVEQARRGKIVLDENDKNIMRIFKLDPNDPVHKKYFARERARTILTNANRGARS